jgi:AraC family transcriptional regulator
MKPEDNNIKTDQSDFIVRSPSEDARRSFLYLVRAGEYVYTPGFRDSRSAFDDFLLFCVLEGSVSLDVDGRGLNVPAGRFCLVDCHRPHASGTSVGARVLWLHFDGVGAREYYRYIADHAGQVVAPADPEAAIDRMRHVVDAARSEQGYPEPEMAADLTLLLSRMAACRPDAKARQKRRQLDQIVAYISTHLTGDLSVPTLAQRMSMSEYHFIRLFKQAMGMTPHAYIVSVRVSAAKYLLASGSMPMTHICTACGFSSVTALGTTFRRSVGMTPTQYRRRNQARIPAVGGSSPVLAFD